MPRQVQVTVSIEIPEGTTRLEDLEELVAGAVRRAGRQLLEAAMPLIEPEVLEASAGARQRKAARYVLTRFGEIRYERWAERLWEHTLPGEVDRVAASLGARVRTGQLEEDEARNLLDYLRHIAA